MRHLGHVRADPVAEQHSNFGPRTRILCHQQEARARPASKHVPTKPDLHLHLTFDFAVLSGFFVALICPRSALVVHEHTLFRSTINFQSDQVFIRLI